MHVKFTYMWGNWETYYTHTRKGCLDDTDRSAYD
ncbi:hypothetical protein LCGC14_2960880, partial [marine sediment metagenome]